MQMEHRRESEDFVRFQHAAAMRNAGREARNASGIGQVCTI